MENIRKCGKGKDCINPLMVMEGNLPIAEFYTDKHKSSGYRSECKKCSNQAPKMTVGIKRDRDLKVIDDYKNKIAIRDILAKYEITESTLHRILRINKVEKVDWWGDLTGQVFGRLTVFGRHKEDGDTTRLWDCNCLCGKVVRVSGQHLRSGHTKSCGCYSAEIASKRMFKHGQSDTDEYLIWKGAKNRAEKSGTPFNLEISDIVIPSTCPILGIPIFKFGGKMGDNSPSIDKFNPELGYVKGNITIMSWKANCMKRNASPEEISKLSEWVLGGGNIKDSTIKLNMELALDLWKDMPEFDGNPKEYYTRIHIKVKTAEDLEELSVLLGRTLTKDTKNIWYPNQRKEK